METTSRLVLVYLVNSIWQLALLAALASLCALALRNAPARWRHILWAAALVLSFLLPLASALRHGVDAVTPPPPSANLDASVGLAGDSAAHASRVAGFSLQHYLRRRSHPISLNSLAIRSAAALYLLFPIFAAARFAFLWRKTRAIYFHAGAQPLSTYARKTVEACRDAIGARDAMVLRSAAGSGPLTIGAFRPRIILPEGFLENVSVDDLRTTLAHEFAHIRRHDFSWNLVYELLSIPASFHPAIRLFQRRLAETRELACDELATSAVSPQVCARSLLNIAENLRAANTIASQNYTLGIFDTSNLEARIMNLLQRRNKISRNKTALLLLASCVLFAGTCFAVSSFSVSILQTNQSPSAKDADFRPFRGTWKASFQGEVILIITLKEENGKPFGTSESGFIHMDEKGEITDATSAEGREKAPLGNLHFQSGAMYFDVPDSPDPPIKFKLTLRGPNEADAQILPEGLPEEMKKMVFKPIPMVREAI
jgi:beta-lactamase regulating signal transducer with metallopeptidase domain